MTVSSSRTHTSPSRRKLGNGPANPGAKHTKLGRSGGADKSKRGKAGASAEEKRKLKAQAQAQAANEDEDERLELGEDDDDDEPDEEVRALDANDVAVKDMARQLELRGLKASGFWAEDVKVLQAEFDKEHIEAAKEAKERRAKQRLQRHQEAQQEAQRVAEERNRREEKLALQAHPRERLKLLTVASKRCPGEAQLSRLTAPLCRSLCRSLAGNTLLVTLDLSHSALDDATGCLLAEALAPNKCLRRVDLEACGLGPNTLGALAGVMERNARLGHLSLENNELTGRDRDVLDGLRLFAESLQHTSGLGMLNLSRTGLGARGGALLAEQLELNLSLVALALGFNGVTHYTERRVYELVARNVEVKRGEERVRRAELLQRRKAAKEAKEARDAAEAAASEERWLQQRKQERARVREEERVAAEQAVLERQRLEEEERLQREEHERARAEAKKKRLAKKKKK